MHIFFRCEVLSRGIKDGYNTAKVEWLKDEPLPEEDIGKYYINKVNHCTSCKL